MQNDEIEKLSREIASKVLEYIGQSLPSSCSREEYVCRTVKFECNGNYDCQRPHGCNPMFDCGDKFTYKKRSGEDAESSKAMCNPKYDCNNFACSPGQFECGQVRFSCNSNFSG